MSETKKAVILARGLGTRMRKGDDSAEMTAEQAAMADTGVKAMIPIDRPFLDYVLNDLAEVGYDKVCLVIGPEHDAVRTYYHETIKTERLQIEFAIQEKPLGTADAVAAAEKFAGDDSVLVINSDNYYPPESLKALREISGSGLAAFDRIAMLDGSNIPAERVTSFAVVERDAEGFMTRILEKPSAEQVAELPEPIGLSMNCWMFRPAIFEGCRKISPSARGELELPDAVMYTIEKMGEKYQAVTVKAPVLDMSCRSDIPAVAAKLAGKPVHL